MANLSEMLAKAKQEKVDNLEAKLIIEKIYDGYLDDDESQWKKKVSFAPSSLFYGSGACAKRWFLSFNGDVFESKITALSKAAMKNGIASHERIQNAISSAGIAEEIEMPIKLESPPIRGFADAILNVDGKRYVCEIKTTKNQNYEYRKNTNKIADYHLAQVLLYMHILGIDDGIVIYESKDENALHGITFQMNDEYKRIVQDILDWCSEVYNLYQKDIMPKRSFRKGSKVCKECPLELACETKDGDTPFRRLSIEGL